jgi:hypothetical protein
MHIERLRNSYVGNRGKIDQFGTVTIARRCLAGRRRRDHIIRAYSPVLHQYAGDKYWAVLQGAVLEVRRSGQVVATVRPHQLEVVEPLERVVTRDGFLIDPLCERSEESVLLGLAASGVDPGEYRKHGWARVNRVYAKQQLIVFWLDDDYAVAFTRDGAPVECVVQFPLARWTWQARRSA